MKKQRVRRKAPKIKTTLILPIGWVVTELVLWDFSKDENIIRHNASQLAKAMQMRYNLDNFGPTSFGIDEE